MTSRADAISEAIGYMGHRMQCAHYRTNGTCDCGRDNVVAKLRAAQPEADRTPELRLCQACGEHLERQLRVEGDLPQSPDRAPGEVEAVDRALVRTAQRLGLTLPGGSLAAFRDAALDALRAEQGQSRDDTVTLTELIRECVEYPGASTPVGWKRRARGALARLGAGRAEGEDRDTENER